MTAAVLLDRLEGVKGFGDGRWRAVCPAHESRHRSLSLAIRETEDGRTLVHCFHGCDWKDVLAAVGLRAADLFPRDGNALCHHAKPLRAPLAFAAVAALDSLRLEGMVLLVVDEQLRRGEPLSDEDKSRLVLAWQRIDGALGVCK